MISKKTVHDIHLEGKRVLVRADFNVPVKDAKISDDFRIRKTIPTLQYLLSRNCKIILISHLGRPKGGPTPEFSLAPVAKRLGELLGCPIEFLKDCVGDEIKRRCLALRSREIVLLENLRFHPEEEKNQEGFARELASLGEVFVQDAFGAVHRAHASVEAVTHFLPSCAGLLLEREVDCFSRLLTQPERPVALILGGAKIHDKIKVIENLIPRADRILIGGGMAYTFLKVLGHSIGSSKFDSEGLEMAKKILEKTKSLKTEVILPKDHIVTDALGAGRRVKTVEGDIEDGWMGVDIGPQSRGEFKKALTGVKTIFWNGPLGIFELEPFSQGTREMALEVARLSSVCSVIGGGDTASAMKVFQVEDKMTHISTGGGASLEFLEGRELPGIKALMDRERVASPL